jgi:hypothetical protein
MGHWVTDLNDGEACQVVVASFLQSLDLLHKNAVQSKGYEPGHDIMTPNGHKLEVKFDILGTLTGNVAIEYQRRKRDEEGNYSKQNTGIRVSQADYWAIMYMADKGEFMKTWDLAELSPQLFIIKRKELFDYVHDPTNKLESVPMGDYKSTDGYKLPVKDLIAQPWCDILEVPFDTENMNDLIFRLMNKLKKTNANLLRKYGKLYR